MNGFVQELTYIKSKNEKLIEQKEGLIMVADGMFAKISELSRSIHATESSQNARYLDLVSAERSLAASESKMKENTKDFTRNLTSLSNERLKARNIFRQEMKRTSNDQPQN